MNDDQITQSVNNLMGQVPEPANGSQPLNNFSLGMNPSFQPPAQQQPQQNDQQQIGQPYSATPPANQLLPQHGTPDPLSGTSQQPFSAPPVVEPNGELGDIRKQALSQLAPLVDKIDQPPEEKYRTLMMMIQASDDQSLIRTAFDAANQIQDPAKKAEALLGIVNEINYFSKSSTDQPTN